MTLQRRVLMQMTTYGRPDQHYSVRDPTSSSKFKTWEVEEIDSRKRKKKGTLGVGNSQIVWSCEADRVIRHFKHLLNKKTPVQTWPITSLIEYNTEKKHLFIELSSPPKPASFHFHAESRAIASEISDAIGEIAGATRAPGLREVAAASGDPLPPLPETSALAQRHKREDSDDLPIDDGIKRGVMLYDFDAQGDDELNARQDQIVEILDDSHEEWWKCKAGSREGVVPASYVEVIKTRPASKNQSPKDTTSSGLASLGSSSHPRKKVSISSGSPTQQQPAAQRNLSKPDISKVRTWTDRTGSFRVEAQFLGLSDDKIQLHKLNGVKISVPLSKMSEADVRYVEKLTGRNSSPPPPKPPPDSEKPKPRRIEFDWFSFFLESGVDYNVCQRYAAAFERDQMDESVLPDINIETLRTLGIREGDILRIMKRLDDKFGRTSSRKKVVRFGGEEVVEGDEKDDLSDVVKITRPTERQESLFSSGPGGALRNNTTRRGRPTTGKSAPEEVDGTLLSTPLEKEEPEVERHGVRPLRVPPSRLANFQEQPKPSGEGFEDDAWAVKEKPARQPQRQPQQSPVVQSPTSLTGPLAGSAIHELASINPPNVGQTLPPPLQPQTSPVTIQFNPRPTAPPVVNRPSSVPPTQTAPQLQPLQQHHTGVPTQPHLTGTTPAQAAGVPSLDEQLTKLQLYRQQQQIQQAAYLSQFQPPQTAFANGYVPQVQPQPTIQLQPQATGYMPNFLPPANSPRSSDRRDQCPQVSRHPLFRQTPYLHLSRQHSLQPIVLVLQTLAQQSNPSFNPPHQRSNSPLFNLSKQVTNLHNFNHKLSTPNPQAYYHRLPVSNRRLSYHLRLLFLNRLLSRHRCCLKRQGQTLLLNLLALEPNRNRWFLVGQAKKRIWPQRVFPLSKE